MAAWVQQELSAVFLPSIHTRHYLDIYPHPRQRRDIYHRPLQHNHQSESPSLWPCLRASTGRGLGIYCYCAELQIAAGR